MVVMATWPTAPPATAFRWLLPLLTVVMVREACGQNVYNFSLADGQSGTLLAAPGDATQLPVRVVWDEVSVDNVAGLLDGTQIYNVDSFTPATASTEGAASFTVFTSGMTEGRHTLELTATVSGASPETLTVVVYIQDPIDVVQSNALLLSPASVVIPLPDGTVTITASVANSSFVAAVLCLWDFGVTNGISDEVALKLPGDFPVQQSFAYDATGKYTVELRCRNTLSSGVSLTSTVEVFGWDMEDFEMDLPKFQLMNGIIPTEDFPLKLKLGSIQLPPSKVTASFTYGDGNPVDTFPLTTLAVSHRFPRRGVYKGSVYLLHPDKGNTTLAFTARVGAFQLHVDTLSGRVAVKQFNFRVEFLGPFRGYARLDFRDGSNPLSPLMHVGLDYRFLFVHRFQNIGFYTVKFYAEQLEPGWQKYNESGVFPDPIEVDGLVDHTLVLTVSPDTVLTPSGEVTATVKLTRPTYGILSLNCVFFFDDEQDPDPRFWNGTLRVGQSFDIPFQYITLGSHDIVCNCSNSLSEYTLTFFVFAYHPCFSDDPIFDRQYRKDNPMVVLNSADLRLVTRTIIYCPLPSFWWWVEEFTPAGISQHTDLQQPYVDFIEFERGALDPGLYRMKVNISFGPESNNTWLAGGTYVRILQTPLIAEIAGGSIRVTGDPGAEIDGYSLSYDPVYGIDNKTGLQFVWQCQTFSTTDIDELVAISSQPLPAKLSSNCDDISTEVLPGQRHLRVDGGAKAAGYLFKLSVKRGNYMSRPDILFLQYNQASFTIELKCEVNCKKKTAVTSPLTFSVTCSACSDADMLDADYIWSLALYTNVTGQYDVLPDSASYFLQSGQDTGPAVVIKENSLLPCRRYRVMVRMTSTSGLNAAAVKEFLTNCPPWGGNCSVVPSAGDVVTQRFELYCTDWQDDGFADPTNATDGEEDDTDDDDSSKALYYKFLLRKNGVTVPIAESGESTMPRVQMPLIVGQGAGVYQIIVRIYDVLQDYTEISKDIYLNASGLGTVEVVSGESLAYWKNQIKYTDKASTLDKQMRGLSTTSGIINTAPIPDDRSTLELAADSEGPAVVKQDWQDLWNDLNNPIPNPMKDELTGLTQTFTSMVKDRSNESARLTAQGVAALGEGMAAVIFNAKTTDDDSVLSSADVAEKGGEALEKLHSTRPYPVGDKLHEAVSSMASLVDKIITSSIPSYDLSIGAHVLFNSTDVGVDDSNFMVSRIKLADAVRDRRKMATTRTAMPKLTKAVDIMLDTLISGVVLGQPPVQVRRDGLALAVSKMTGRSLANSTVSANSALDLQLDPEDGAGNDAEVEVKTSVFNKNPFAWASDASSYEVTSPVVKVNMTDKKGARKLRKLTMRLKRGGNTPVPVLDTYSSEDTRAGPDGWLFHRMTLRSGSSAVVTRFQLPDDMSRVMAYFRTGRPPTSIRYDVRTAGQLVESRQRRAAKAPAKGSSPLGDVYQFFVPPGSLSPGIVFAGFHLPELGSNATRLYGFSSFSDMCRVWNEDTETWDPTACTVSAFTSPEETVCICNNPPGTSFASSFFVAPNTIDFSTVFSKFDITNASVYGTLIGLLLLWVLALLWARRKDHQDKLRWMVGYLLDNYVGDDRFYLMTVYTGLRSGAGTQSNVSFILTGSKADTGVRQLSDGERPLSRGSVLSYILSTSNALGHLKVLRLWHDDSAEGEHASWYLSRVVLEDLQTGTTYNFIFERWFARDKEDGLIDHAVPPVSQTEVLTFDQLFQERARVEITDSHLWLSCLMRPDRSSFTRRQRVSCCFALLLLTMITSALFYQPEDNETGESTNKLGTEVSIGPLRFSLTTVWTSTVSIVITTIPLFIFVILFRSYRPMPGPRVTVRSHPTTQTRMAKILKKLAPKTETERDVERGSESDQRGGEGNSEEHGSKDCLEMIKVQDESEAHTIDLNVAEKTREGVEQITGKGSSREDLGQLKDRSKEDVKDMTENDHSKEDVKDMTENDHSKEDVEHPAKEGHSNEDVDPQTGKDHQEEGAVKDDHSEEDAEQLAEKRRAEESAAREAFRKQMAQNLSDLLDNVLQQNPLPHFCVYVTWVVLVVTMAICAFFLILYSMQWGSTTSEEWLASFFLSFFESFFLLDPIKVLVLACLLAYCAGNPFSVTQHQYVDLHRVHTEVQTFGSPKIDREARPPEPVSREVVEAARKRRQQERLAHRVFFELIIYAIFVFFVFSVSYGNRDQRAYRTNQHLDNLLYSASGHAPFPFESISSREDMIRYVKETLISSAFPWTDMVGNELPWQQRLYTSDGVSFRVGPVRVRQVRMPRQRTLKVLRWYPRLQGSSGEVYPPYSSEQEERGSYCLGWKPTPCSDEELTNKLSVASWSYQEDVLPVSIWGTYAYYSSGGYSADLTVNRDVVMKLVDELEEERWLDLQTRAVFVELCLYNPNTNLFTFLRLGAEFPVLGAASVWRDFKTLRLYQHQGALGAFVFVSELAVLLFVLIFTVRIALTIKSQKCAFFTDAWQVLDFMTLIVTFVALVFYIAKLLSVKEVMDLWRYNPKVYVDFFLPVLWDAIYGYILAGLVFVLSIRLLRLLGYNQRVTMLATVLSRSGPALVGYFLVFFIILSAYVSAGHVMFVTSMEQFRSLLSTYSTLYIVLLGTNRIGNWIRTSPLWAQAYYISFTFLVLFVLYSMFQAILCNTTVQVKADMDSIPPPYGLTNVVAKFYRFITDLIPARFLKNNSLDPVPENTTEKKQEQDVPKERLSSNRPDEILPDTAALFRDLKAEVEKLNKELHELLRRRNEERRRRRERRKRKKEKAAAAERYRQQAEEREAAHEAGITTHSIGLEEENGATAATQGNGRHTSTVRNRQRNKKSNTLDTQKKLQEFMRKSPYAHPPLGKPPV